MIALDRELLDSLADRPELVALADAIAETQRAPRARSVRRHVALVVIAALAVGGVALAGPWGGAGPATVERALAALGSGPVLHAVVEYSGHDVLVDLETGAEQPLVHRAEYWYDAERATFRAVLSENGQPVSESVLTPTHHFTETGRRVSDGTTASLPPPLASFVSGYREALATGDAVDAGTRSVDGRRARLLAFTGRSGELTTVAVDAETYRPLELRSRYPGGRLSPVFTVREIELLPRRPGQFAPPPVGPPRPSVGGGTAPAVVGLREAETALGMPVLWLGSHGLEAVERSNVFTELSDGTRVEGVVVHLRYRRTSVRLSSGRAGAYALGVAGRGWSPPAGWTALTRAWGRHASWETSFGRGAMSVRVTAPTKRELVAALRALRKRE